MRVLRYPLKWADYQVVEVVSPGAICSVAYRSVEPFGELPLGEKRIDMWAFAGDDDSAKVAHRVWIVGTGHEAPVEGVPFVGTVIDVQGFVWHVFAGPIEERFV